MEVGDRLVGYKEAQFATEYMAPGEQTTQFVDNTNISQPMALHGK